MKVHDIFILKDGLPMHHYKHEKSKLNECLDESLITGFLSAIINFTKETGLGIPTFYITKSIKFSFFEQSELLFVICSNPSLSDSLLNALIFKLSSFILKELNNPKGTLESAQFERIITQVLFDLQKSDGCLLKPIKNVERDDIYFKEIIPKRHIDERENLRNIRRKLFKLINGKNSIYDLAIQMNASPSKILNILRSYQKEGIISF